MQSAMSGEISDTYAVADMSKIGNDDNSQLHQDSNTDVYAVVNKKRKINHETTNMGKLRNIKIMATKVLIKEVGIEKEVVCFSKR